jgi:hypothetical protein
MLQGFIQPIANLAKTWLVGQSREGSDGATGKARDSQS